MKVNRVISGKFLFFVYFIVIFIVTIGIFLGNIVNEQKKDYKNKLTYFSKVNKDMSDLKKSVSSNKELAEKVKRVDSMLVFLQEFYKTEAKVILPPGER